MKCPRCDKQPLVPRQVKDKDVTVAMCPKCKGLWFDRGELERAVPGAVEGLTVPEDAERGSGECPRCWGTLYRFLYPGTYVQVDMCGRCSGLWLDAGEIQEIHVVRKAMKGSTCSKDRKGVGGSLLRFLGSAFGSSDPSKR